MRRIRSIRCEAGRLVKRRAPSAWVLPAFVLSTLLLQCPSSFAEPAPGQPPLPGIEARTFDVRTKEMSKSGTVWLFEAQRESIPPVGKVILLKRGAEAITAVRVLKSFPDKESFAAKVLRNYSSAGLSPSEPLMAVEKVSEVAAIAPSQQDKAELKELEKSLPPATAPIAPPQIAVEAAPALEPVTNSALQPPPPAPAPILAPEPAATSALQAAPTTPADMPPPPQTAPLEAAPTTGALAPIANDSPPPPPGDLPAIPNEPAPEPVLGESPPPPGSAGGMTDLPSQNAGFDPVTGNPAGPGLNGDPALNPQTPSASLTPIDEPPDEDTTDEDKGLLGISVEDMPTKDPNYQWFSGGFGFFENNTSYFAGGGVRYGLTLKQFIFFGNSSVQDSITPEIGAFFYKILDLETENDSYNVTPVLGTLRYNLQLNEGFGLFFYAGMLRNFVSATSNVSSQATADTLAHLDTKVNGLVPIGGAGMLFRTGPNWLARVDIGTDFVGLGLVLKF